MDKQRLLELAGIMEAFSFPEDVQRAMDNLVSVAIKHDMVADDVLGYLDEAFFQHEEKSRK